jgi:hypothetical protein
VIVLGEAVWRADLEPSARRSILLYLNNRRGCLEGSSWCRVLEDVDVVVLVVLVALVVPGALSGELRFGAVLIYALSALSGELRWAQCSSTLSVTQWGCSF